jgi:hypothetical protein
MHRLSTTFLPENLSVEQTVSQTALRSASTALLMIAENFSEKNIFHIVFLKNRVYSKEYCTE